jgi:hypothetical protein
MIRAIALVSIALVAGVQDEADKALRAKLRSLRLDVDISGWSVTQLADYLREVTGFNIVVDPSATADPASMTLKAKGVSVQSILNILLKPQKLGFVVEEGVLRIAREEKLRGNVRLEIFDLRDLLMPIRDFPGVEITLTDTVGTAFTPPDDPAPAEFPIVDLIKAHTGARAWDDNPKASIRLEGGLLIVRQTPEVIAQVRKLVGFLRRFR